MVVLISVHLLTGHWLFHGRAPASGAEVSLLLDRACGTLCRLRYDRWPATDSLGDIWKHICLEPRNHGASWCFVFLHHINTLTYSLTSYLAALVSSSADNCRRPGLRSASSSSYIWTQDCVQNLVNVPFLSVVQQSGTPSQVNFK